MPNRSPSPRAPAFRRPAAVAALALGLAACTGDDAPPPPCPQAEPVADAARLVAFRGEGRDLTDMRFRARIEGVSVTCDYEPDDEEIEADLRVAFSAERGPAIAAETIAFTYFVAVTTREQRILAREEFDLRLPLEGNRTRVAAVDELTPRIPLGEDRTGADYRLYVGFALSPEQVEYNRRNRP